ncbi:terpene synthase 10-like isoform X1 [Cicer arietinum]|uniref:(E)-beta-ocimene synthase n=1 Tax=Cicer arietinum TaxID=3827 RepID=A0A1S2XFX2_CICAR|nr:terpene synthase 10-like isoform X1 [Cicer arietinum]
MALLTFKSPEFTFKQKLILEERYLSRVIWTSNFPRPTRCKASYKVETIPRRSSKFQPSIWTNDYIQSLSSEYKEEMYREQCKVLSEEVRMMLCKVKNEIDQLEFIDVLQRLGVAYHFNNEIRNILDNIYNTQTSNLKNNLYATSLKFRLLRQHRYNISTDVFIDFQDEMCNFKKEQPIDVEAMLSMYEASFHSFANETILDELRDVTSKFLKEYLKNGGNHISLLISHALELPLHWRIPRWEAWWFINICERQQNQNHVLLQFAKLDFNIVQSIYQEELKYTSRWWKRTELGEKLSFSRDRLVENFVWTMGTNFKPEFEYFRKVITKVNSFITTIDDVYDVYGTLEELELFTHTIERWDLSAMNSLPYYMKICFLALYNFVNELAFEILKKSGYYIIPYLKKVWADLCKSYLIEAKWYHSKYTPTLGEYLENAWISISAPVILTHAYIAIPHSFKIEDLASLEEDSKIIYFSTMILRFANDIGSYKREIETGDIPKSIQCYMNESGVSEVEACDYIKSMICTMWKKMNKEAHTSSFSQSFIDTCINHARMAMFMYEHGDGHSIQDLEIQNRITSLALQPIPFICTKNSELNNDI